MTLINDTAQPPEAVMSEAQAYLADITLHGRTIFTDPQNHSGVTSYTWTFDNVDSAVLLDELSTFPAQHADTVEYLRDVLKAGVLWEGKLYGSDTPPFLLAAVTLISHPSEGIVRCYGAIPDDHDIFSLAAIGNTSLRI